jgi:diacylglycerol O-acyltransferase / wax synthase
MHVGSLQLYVPPDGADALDVRQMFTDAMTRDEPSALFLKRPKRSVTSLGQWGWVTDKSFDLEHHVRNSALAQPARVRELLALVSRLHSTLLDRHRPLWEMHLIEGLADGRYGVYFKVHHSLIDGVSALKMLGRQLSADADERDMPAPWAPPPGSRRPRGGDSPNPAQRALHMLGDTAGLAPALVRTLRGAITEQSGTMSLSAPKSMFNVPITGARRFAAQSWPMERIKAVGKNADATVNDVVLAMCSGALRNYMRSEDALPDDPLIAMVPVSLHDSDAASGDGGGNAVGVVMCNLGTHLDDAADRLANVHRSMTAGKEALSTMSQMQILMMSALGVSPLAILPALGLTGTVRPPFNLVISNVPGPREPMYWNGARLDGLYPLSIPLDGQALNITCTSYADEIAFGLTGCRRSVPHLQRLLRFLDEELDALEQAVGR